MKHAVLILILFLSFKTSSVLGCSKQTTLNFPEDCNLSLRYSELKEQFKSRFDVNIEYILRYRALRFIDANFWDYNKERIEYLPWMAYGRKTTKKKIIKPDPKVWLFWERGDFYSLEYWKEAIENRYFNISDLKDLHRNIIDVTIMSKYSVNRKGARPGKLRTSIRQKAPGWNSKCKKYPMKEKDLNFFLNYDLKTAHNIPLVRVKKYKRCKNKNGYYYVKIRYLKSSLVPKELQRLLDFINQRWDDIVTGRDKTLSPIDFIADIQRWFVSIHPFGDGNGRASRILQDVIAKSFNLPYPPTGYLTNDILTPKNSYRLLMRKQMNRMLGELEYCLNEYDKKDLMFSYQMDKDCSQIYLDMGNHEKRNSKKVFKNYLDQFLDTHYKDIKRFFSHYPIPKVSYFKLKIDLE